MNMLALVVSLPTAHATVRMRTWRALKASGAAVLHDGVYLLPQRGPCRAVMEGVAREVVGSEGTAHLMAVEALDDTNFPALFDRSDDYAPLLREASLSVAAVTPDTAAEGLKAARKLRRQFTHLADIDFFPGEAQRQTQAALETLELACAHHLSPDEPSSVQGGVARLALEKFQKRTWATRRRPWVDRLASAWLIQRFIDPQARFQWLAAPEDCPAKAVGFDFDGATFTHVGNRVTFEVLMASFGLEPTAGLTRLGRLVHFLDAGGVQPPEAAGVEAVLAGLREALTDDDQLLAAAHAVFEGLLAGFAAAQETR
ncbi:MAG: chromate resistance protein ChrB domain-containing protein [Pseudomonadota bacterium]